MISNLVKPTQMKSILTLLLFASVSAYSQTSDNKYIVHLNSDQEEDYVPTEVVIKKNNTYTAGFLNNVPGAVLSEFSKKYEGAKNVSWFVEEKTVTVYFVHDDAVSIVKYLQDGLELLKRKSYSANKLKPALATFIKEQTKDYDIRYVNESEKENAHHYEINLVKDQQWLILKINEDKYGQFLVTGRVSFDK